MKEVYAPTNADDVKAFFEMGTQASKICKRPSAKEDEGLSVEGDAASSMGLADESGKSGLVKPDDIVAKSVDAPVEVRDENVHDDVSVVERGYNSHVPQTSASNDGAFDERLGEALEMATDDYKPLMGLNDVDNDVVLEQCHQATLTEENVQKWGEML